MATSTDNMKAQMRKGMLEYSILLLLQGGDAYAGEIIQGLKDAHLIVVEGTLYPLLTRLKTMTSSPTAGKNHLRGHHANITL